MNQLNWVYEPKDKPLEQMLAEDRKLHRKMLEEHDKKAK